MLEFCACGEPVFEGRVETDTVVGEEVAERAGPMAPVFHTYFALTGPVVLCVCCVGVFIPCVCMGRGCAHLRP